MEICQGSPDIESVPSTASQPTMCKVLGPKMMQFDALWAFKIGLHLPKKAQHGKISKCIVDREEYVSPPWAPLVCTSESRHSILCS